MSEKIEWYKEVLELEPNSKVFLPLARLLMEENDASAAINILQEGLRRHPEFLEARLFLVEVLYKCNMREECDAEINILAAMFKKYAGFWQAWAACLGSNPKDEDTASVMRFLAVTFMHGPLSFHEILDRGLATYLQPVQPVVSAKEHETLQDIGIAKTGRESSNYVQDSPEFSEASSYSEIASTPTDSGPNEDTAIGQDKLNMISSPDEGEVIPGAIASSLQNSNTGSLAQSNMDLEIQTFEVDSSCSPVAKEPNVAAEIQTSPNTIEDKDSAGIIISEENPSSPDMTKAVDNNEGEQWTIKERIEGQPEATRESEREDLENIKGLGGESLKELFEDNEDGHTSFASDFSVSQLTNDDECPDVQGEIGENESFERNASTEPYSIRTRSMADVLADQEDYRGALEIYRELLESVTDQVQREELLGKIEAMSKKLEETEVLSTDSLGSLSQMISSKSKDKLISMLETLARRVEARTRG